MVTGARHTIVVAGMASYLDAGALVSTGLAVGGPYADAFSLDRSTVGLLLGLQTLAFAVGALLGGRWADRRGRRVVLLRSLALYAAGVALLAAAWGTVALVVGVVLSGLAIGADLPTSLALMGEEAPVGRRGAAVAGSQVLWAAGITTTGLLALALAGTGVIGARLLYVHLLVVALLVLGARLRLGESGEWRRAAHLERDRVAGPGLPAAAAAVPAEIVPAAVTLGLFYTLWNLGANTLGQFRPYLWIHLFGGSVRGAATLVLLGMPLGLLGSLAFVRVVDTSARQRWIVVGAVAGATGWLTVTMWPTRQAFVLLVVCGIVGAALAGEAAYKVWVHELVPTLYRGVVQGATLAVARCVAGVAAFGVPALAAAHSRALFGMLLLTNVAAGVIAVWWMPRLRRRHGQADPSAPPAVRRRLGVAGRGS